MNTSVIGVAWVEIVEFVLSWLPGIYDLNFSESLLQSLAVTQYLINMYGNYLRLVLLETIF